MACSKMMVKTELLKMNGRTDQYVRVAVNMRCETVATLACVTEIKHGSLEERYTQKSAVRASKT